MVPADLGGIKDPITLARGLAFAATKQGKAALDKIGILGEYAPELTLTRMPKVFGQKSKILGVGVPSRDSLRDASLAMFRGSDQFNRYVSGGSAYVKWEDATRKVFSELRPGQIPSQSSVRTFLKKAGVNGRTEVTRTRIESLVRSGHLEEARSIFVRDVVADTQFLYGHADSPLIAHQWGGVGKTGIVFQSWWMNYGSALRKWVTTGTPAERATRMTNWALSHTLAYLGMRQMWDARTSAKTAYLGPFPDITDSLVPTPPIMDVVHKVLKAPIAVARALPKGEGGEMTKKQAISLLKAGVSMFVPGGLQFVQSTRAGMEEGFPGLAKSILRINREPFRK